MMIACLRTLQLLTEYCCVQLARQNWLYGEMLLYTLKQVSDTTVDTSCWLDR